MSTESQARLIEQYRDAVSARARLRRILFSVTLTAFIVFGMLLWSSGRTFATSGIAAVHTELNDYLHANGEHYADSLAKAAGGVAAAYKTAAIKQIGRDLPKIEAITQRELDKLNDYTQKRWKDFEQELVAMSHEQEGILREELAKITQEDRAKQIALSYGAEMDGRVKKFLTTAFSEHLRVGEEIAQNLNKITELEPDIEHPVDVNHVIGLTLELAGLELQDIVIQ